MFVGGRINNMEYVIKYVVVLIIVDFVLAFIPARIADKKGYSTIGFYFFGLCLFMPALIVALCLTDKVEEARRETRHRAELEALRQTVSGGLAPTRATAPKIDPICPSCGRENSEDVQFCKACGTRLNSVTAATGGAIERQCVKCNTVYYEDDEFCGKCGAPLKDIDILQVMPENGVVICPKCGARQMDNRASCYRCGARFEYECT
jgi:predicted nucleic acid-binding Zn ribbon protein